MNYDQQFDLNSRSPTAIAFLPPAAIQETAWDILLALHSDGGSKLGLDKLAGVVSVEISVLNQWLAMLERRQLIAAKKQGSMQEARAVLTPSGRELIDRYLSVTIDLQFAAHD